MKNLKIAIVNTYDSKDVKMWSGIPYHILLMLEKLVGHQNVICIERKLKRNVYSYIKGIFFNKILKKKYLSWADQDIIKSNYEDFSEIRNAGYDIIITFQFFIIPLVANEKSKIIFWGDATFKNLTNFYDYVSNLSNFSIENGNSIQKKALLLSDATIFTSHWAINSAVNDYGINPSKINLIPFASNLSRLPNQTEINEIINKRNDEVIKLLFLGVNWDRKGGDKAVEVVEKLNKAGFKSILYIVGTDTPDKYKDNKHLVNLGFISKDSVNGETQIIELLKSSDYLILPTTADCTPVVFCEAGSYGLPVITTDVGGIPSVVLNGINGYSFNQESFVDEAVTMISKLGSSFDLYQALCNDSFQYYHNQSSWVIVKERFVQILNMLLDDDINNYKP